MTALNEPHCQNSNSAVAQGCSRSGTSSTTPSIRRWLRSLDSSRTRSPLKQQTRLPSTYGGRTETSLSRSNSARSNKVRHRVDEWIQLSHAAIDQTTDHRLLIHNGATGSDKLLTFVRPSKKLEDYKVLRGTKVPRGAAC